jgi:SAM-dependent methyltransferase
MDTLTIGVDRSTPPSTWARISAVVYDPFLWRAERAGQRERRHELVARATGRTVEIGAGTGLNLTHYPDDLDELLLVEPDGPMRARLTKRLDASDRSAKVFDAPAEHLPFPDESIDTVVSTLVLCTVDAPHLALREIARVLKPDGQLLFLEHVRAESPRLARWQDRMERPWRAFARGCRCNRATAGLIVACGLQIDELSDARWRRMPRIVRPLIVGRARRPDRSAP